MKKIIRNVENEGLMKLLGQKVTLFCANYFYTGILIGVNRKYVLLEDPAIVYETGPWSDKSYKDEQKLGYKEWYVMTSAIESFGQSK